MVSLPKIMRNAIAVISVLLYGASCPALGSMNPGAGREEMRTAPSGLKQKILARQQTGKSGRRVLVPNREGDLAEGRAFLGANSKKEGVVARPSGLQYLVINEGSGKNPGLHDTVLVNYRGTLIDGTEFGRSRDGNPERRRVDAMIPGMREALPLMKEGAKWRIFVPANLAYGERGPLADRTVIIDLELVSIEATHQDTSRNSGDKEK